MILHVFLHGIRVGAIRRESDTGVLSFVLDENYAAQARRPVLGQQFEERRSHRIFRQAGYPGQLPSFFGNLLPEGALEAMILREFQPADAAAMLAVVGEDLPGAVVVKTAAPEDTPPKNVRRYDEPFTPAADAGQSLRFSLAGVQLKFSAVHLSDERFTLPFKGLGGRWILKFGSEAFPGLPENEYAVMNWARSSGLNVPETKLVSVQSIEGLDERFHALGSNVFAIRRFDRLSDGSRVHQEDFAQVWGVPPHLKYSGSSLEGIGRFIGDLCGPDDLTEYFERVLFCVLCGNTDPHLKNWSLVYPDMRSARLSPAYDLVCVRQYLETNELALPLDREKRPERISWGHIQRIDRYLEKSGHAVGLKSLAARFVIRALDEWKRLRFTVDERTRAAVDRHLDSLALVREIP